MILSFWMAFILFKVILMPAAALWLQQHIYCFMLEKPRAVPHCIRFNPHPGQKDQAYFMSHREGIFIQSIWLYGSTVEHANRSARSLRDLRQQNERIDERKCTITNKSQFAEVINVSFTGPPVWAAINSQEKQKAPAERMQSPCYVTRGDFSETCSSENCWSLSPACR